jgi:O-antigen/teichoic acid export membrane protein
MSVGADGTALAAVGASLAFMAVIYLTALGLRRVDRPTERNPAAEQRRFARNTILPIATSLADRVVFWAFWIVVLRLIGPEGNGTYAFAANLLAYFAAIVDFGLGTLVTRDVARNTVGLHRIFSLALALRTRVLALSLPLMVGIALIYWITGAIDTVTLIATSLLALGLPFAAVNQAYASVYGAWERMDRRGFVVIGTSGLTVGLGLAFLAAGLGVPGIALAGLFSSIATFFALGKPVGFKLLRGSLGGHGNELIPLVRQALPLMLNSLLATAFIQIDVLVLQPIHGTEVVGHYNAAYKFLNALNVLPAAVVLAAFPLMARTVGDAAELASWFVRTWRVLATTAAIAVMFLFIFAEPLIDTLLGRQYLPQTATALTILIWFLPLSYLNGTLQYVVIASDRQWWLTPAFMTTTLFNLFLNLALVPTWGIVSAAATTIGSEIVLLLGLTWITRRDRLLLYAIEPAVRPLLAAGAFAAVAIPLRDQAWVVSALAATAAYLTVLVTTGGLELSTIRDVVHALRNEPSGPEV